jgi:predicted GNAT superfamily acetyltransferase
MKIEIRPIVTASDYLALEELQREIWGAQELEIIPYHLLLTVQKNGGILLGAFTIVEGIEHLVGFVFGFAGITSNGRVKHCSHVAGVTPKYQDQNIGHRLKLAQRQHALAQGIDLITWTFDPLESRNARFNFHKLGAICNRYFRHLYGEMRDDLNAGLPSDRFEVVLEIRTKRVEAHL